MEPLLSVREPHWDSSQALRCAKTLPDHKLRIRSMRQDTMKSLQSLSSLLNGVALYLGGVWRHEKAKMICSPGLQRVTSLPARWPVAISEGLPAGMLVSVVNSMYLHDF